MLGSTHSHIHTALCLVDTYQQFCHYLQQYCPAYMPAAATCYGSPAERLQGVTRVRAPQAAFARLIPINNSDLPMAMLPYL